MASLPHLRPRQIATLLMMSALAGATLAPAAARAAGEVGAATTLGASVLGVASEASGAVIAVGSTGSSMLVHRVAADGTPELAFAAGTGTATAVAVQADGAIVVAGDDGGPVVRRFTATGEPDLGFGTAGSATIPGSTASALAIGPGGTIVVVGSATGADGIARVAISRLLPSGSRDPAFGGDGSVTYDLGRNSQANGVAVQANGRIVFAGQRAPGLQITEALIGRVRTNGALDSAFADAGVYAYDAQGGANAVFNGVAIDAAGRIVGAGADLRGSGSLATFVRLTAAGSADAGFGTKGVIRTVASANTDGGDAIGARALTIAGGGQIVGVGAFQDSGLRSSALWAITPAGGLDPAVGIDGLVVTGPTTSDGRASHAVTVTPDGGIVAGGVNTSFAGPTTGVLQQYGGFGPLSNDATPLPVPDPARTPGGAGTAPAKLAVVRAAIKGTRLDVLALKTRNATGTLRVTFANNGTTTRFSVRLRGGTPFIRIRRVLPSRARKGRTGIVTLTYGGNDTVRRDRVRLRAAAGKALLTRRRSQIDRAGFLVVSGTISARARGLVRVRLDYADRAERAFSLTYPAKIKVGRWIVEAKLPGTAIAAGGQLSIQYSGDRERRIRGEQVTKALRGLGGGRGAS